MPKKYSLMYYFILSIATFYLLYYTVINMLIFNLELIIKLGIFFQFKGKNEKLIEF